jgi:hypothetical protein
MMLSFFPPYTYVPKHALVGIGHESILVYLVWAYSYAMVQIVGLYLLE